MTPLSFRNEIIEGSACMHGAVEAGAEASLFSMPKP